MLVTNIAELTGIKFYKCFSQRLSHNIQTKLNILPIEVYTHKNGKIVNVYIMTKELSDFLVEWSNNKPTKAKGGNNGKE